MHAALCKPPQPANKQKQPDARLAHGQAQLGRRGPALAQADLKEGARDSRRVLRQGSQGSLIPSRPPQSTPMAYSFFLSFFPGEQIGSKQSHSRQGSQGSRKAASSHTVELVAVTHLNWWWKVYYRLDQRSHSSAMRSLVQAPLRGTSATQTLGPNLPATHTSGRQDGDHFNISTKRNTVTQQVADLRHIHQVGGEAEAVHPRPADVGLQPMGRFTGWAISVGSSRLVERSVALRGTHPHRLRAVAETTRVCCRHAL